MFSIIIPTLNEENYLPRLLKSIKKQTFKDYEIIIADAGSTDSTKKIAKELGCKVIKGGLPGKGRNEGAKIAKSDLLLFLDADIILPDDFLEKTIKEFEKKKLDTASFFLVPITSNGTLKNLFSYTYRGWVASLERPIPHGAMGILNKKSIHQKINGYDESLKLCEDHDYVQRSAKVGKFRVIRGTRIFYSLRRFHQDGFVRTCLKYVGSEMHHIFIGPIKSDIFKYKFNHYSKNKKKLNPTAVKLLKLFNHYSRKTKKKFNPFKF